jgi:PAS domain S-box-containing protein
MVEETQRSENKKQLVNSSFKSDIVIGVNRSGKIIKFNKESEKISGYSKYEVLDKNFLDFLTPDRYLKQWKKSFSSAKKNKLIEDFKLPLQTRNGHEIMISWSTFPVSDDESKVKDISFVGRLISKWDDAKESNIGQAENINKNLNESDDFYKIFKQIEEKNQELEKINSDLEKKLKKKKTKNEKTGQSFSFFPNISLGNQKKEELENMARELEDQKLALDQLQTKLNNEKRSIDEQRNWFVKWREKLESLEFEIEKRNQSISSKEKFQSEKNIKPKTNIPVEEKTGEIEKDQDIFAEIDDSAVIIQRGILKQANEAFAKLLGYSLDEIVNKSLFDFICYEGFPGLEEYYLERLKGEDASIYETVFLTKDNEKISVKVQTKPTFFDKDKAEIAIIKKVNKKEK